MFNLLHNTEIEYVKCFSQCIEEEKKIRFRDDSIPDMYAHNFILLKNGLSDDEINHIILKELERSVKENKSFLQLEANFSLSSNALKNLNIFPEITKYYYMSIPTCKYNSLKEKEECTIEEAVSQKVLEDGIRVDIQANSPAMGEEFSKKRIYRKVQAYNSISNFKFYVCYDKGIPVGNCELFINNNIAKIEDFDILEKYQRKGFGTAFLKHLLMISEKLGVDKAYVITDSEDTAKDMYRKCGFCEVGEKTTILFQW
ncbi:GNAT family N-acetyltransferase [uncultured Clostridium sp.]|uniref:GNAT family N-acetyltransferase n=1 Tax=uncultured Clostridium sp. TaxID=59620 RepID=UPI0028E492E6|nr:GNAT family N-acetyltransferase [uncultured Clostridium sp.]